jgi:putative serine protease PepD
VTLTVFSAAVGAITVSAIDPAGCRHCDSSRSGARPAVDLPSSTLERAAARAIPSVVKLETEPDRPSTVGSGIVLTADGLLLTSRHVLSGGVAGASAISPDTLLATFADGRAARLIVVGTDPATDVAVVRAEGISGCTPITLGSSAALRAGQRVVAVGSPLGLENSVTSGVVSALHRPIPIAVDPTGRRITVLDTIQTDTTTNFGSSGGALVDNNGALIGMNSLIGTRGVGFALPIDPTIRIANELISAGTASHAFLGVQVTRDNKTRGAKVIRTTPNSPAAAAGLYPGTVITGIGDRTITSAEALVAAVLSKAPGDTVTATYIDAAGSRQTSTIALASDRAWSTADTPNSPAGTSELRHGALGSELTWSV